MGRVYMTIVLLGAGSLPAAAQRLDGCVDFAAPLPHGISQGVSREVRDRGLQDAGYSLTRDSLVRALGDQRADVRSVAALKLALEVGSGADFAPILQAWQTENDTCTKIGMSIALSGLVGGLALDAKQHPGDQPRVTPFQSCAPSEHSVAYLTIEQSTDATVTGPTVRISVRNQTSQTLAFVKTGSPAELYSVTVMGPTGDRIKVTRGQEWMYEPVKRGNLAGLINRGGPVFQPIPPEDEVSWIWRIGDDFDMSAPGTYRVSFGGRIDYLDTTVCSNTLSMTVE